MRRSWFTILCRDTPNGTVPLPWRELAAGRLRRYPAYEELEESVRAASDALLQFGLTRLSCLSLRTKRAGGHATPSRPRRPTVDTLGREVRANESLCTASSAFAVQAFCLA